ncbi:hypothetical protein HK104_007565 [Borealophlyctis nickersoniae]|nr:hypothetical protein HK104_007565 [Borealophlyctis nickersoniae]
MLDALDPVRAALLKDLREMCPLNKILRFHQEIKSDCINDWCGGSGQFIDTIMKRCNSTLSKINPNSPPEATEVKKMLGDCICGSSDDGDGLDALSAGWATCVRCLNGLYGIQDSMYRSSMNDTTFTDACACVEPGRLDAVLNMSNSSFVCTKKDATLLGGRNRKRPVPNIKATPTNNATAPAASTSGGSARATASGAPAATSQAPAAATNRPATNTAQQPAANQPVGVQGFRQLAPAVPMQPVQPVEAFQPAAPQFWPPNNAQAPPPPPAGWWGAKKRRSERGE